MANVCLLTANPTHASQTRITEILVAKGHTVTALAIASTSAATVIGGGYDCVIATVCPENATDSNKVRAINDAGIPVAVGVSNFGRREGGGPNPPSRLGFGMFEFDRRFTASHTIKPVVLDPLFTGTSAAIGVNFQAYNNNDYSAQIPKSQIPPCALLVSEGSETTFGQPPSYWANIVLCPKGGTILKNGDLAKYGANVAYIGAMGHPTSATLPPADMQTVWDNLIVWLSSQNFFPKLSGMVTDAAGNPLERKVLAYRTDTGQYVGCDQSDANGEFEIVTMSEVPHFLIAQEEPGGDKNDVIAARVVPIIG